MQLLHDLYNDILANGTYKLSRAVDPKTGKTVGTVAVFGRTLRHKLSEGFPLLTTKQVSFHNVKEELLWFIRGEDNIKSLQAKGVKIWNEWAQPNGDVGPIYGVQWRRWQGLAKAHHEDALGLLSSIQCGIERPEADGEYSILLNRAQEWDEAAGDVRDYLEQGTIDQLHNVIQTLKANPNDRRMVVSAWNPAQIAEMGLPPCHYAFQFVTRLEHLPGCPSSPTYSVKMADFYDIPNDPVARWRDERTKMCYCGVLTARGVWPQRRLDCIVHMRSADAFLGVPYNLASYALLTSMVAQVTDMRPGDLMMTFADLHIYENHIDQVAEQLAREPRELPKLLLHPPIRDIDGFESEHIQIEGYDPHPAIKAPVAV